MANTQEFTGLAGQFAAYPGVALKWHPLSNGLVPEEVRRYYIRFLQDYFKASNDATYSWHPDPAQTKVLIGGPDMNVEDTDVRPSVIVSFNGGRWMGVYKDQYVQDIAVKNPATNDFYYTPSGKIINGKLYSDTFRGNMTCICRDRETRATSLANKVFMGITVFKDVLRYMGLFEIGLPSISKEFPIKSDVKEINTEVRVDSEYMLNMRWTLTPYNPEAGDKNITIPGDDPKQPIIPGCIISFEESQGGIVISGM